MTEFFKYLTEHFWASVAAIIGIISGVTGIITFAEYLKKQPASSNRKRILAASGIILLICLFYLCEQYDSFKQKGDGTKGPDNPSAEITAANKEEASAGNSMENSVNVQGSDISISGEDNTVIIGNGYSSLTASVIVTKVSLNKTDLHMRSGETAVLTAKVLYSDNSQDNHVIWLSSDESVAAVDENGNITALSSGTAIITAQASKNNSAVTEECVITVSAAPTGYSISLSSTQAILYETFHIYVEPYDNDITQIEIISVSPSGEVFRKPLNDGAFFIYTETGLWTISASLKNGAGVYEGQKEEDFVTIEIINLLEH